MTLLLIACIRPAVAHSLRVPVNAQWDGTSVKGLSNDWAAGFSEHSGNTSDHKALAWVHRLGIGPLQVLIQAISNSVITYDDEC